MEEKTLTKREFIGYWNYAKFINEEGLVLRKELTDEEYSNLENISVPEGYRLDSVGQGAFKADTETGFLEDGEFMVIDGRTYANINGIERFINIE